MKKLLFGLLVFSSISTFAGDRLATSINFTTETHWFNRFPDQMEDIVADGEYVLDQYLGETLECRLVQLQFNNLQEPGIFRKGQYNLTLRAKCNKSFENFKLGIVYGVSLGEPIKLNIGYKIDGHQVNQILEI